MRFGYFKALRRHIATTKARNSKAESHTRAVIDMVNLRRHFDPRLKKTEPPSSWLPHVLENTTEAMIANAVEFSEFLIMDGLTEQGSIHRLLDSLGLSECDNCNDLVAYLTWRLSVVDPEYLALDILSPAISIAKAGARAEIKKRVQAPSFPPRDWLNFKISQADIPKNDLNNRDMVRLLLRWREGDEIWTFSTPAGMRRPWQEAGVALMREGCLIDHAVTDQVHIYYSDAA